jgi:hypothetical protein
VTSGRRSDKPALRAVAIPGFALLLAACGSAYSGSTLAQQVTGWARSTGFSADVSSVQGDIRRVDSLSAGSQSAGSQSAGSQSAGSQSAGSQSAGPQAKAIETACAVLVQDTLVANENLPTPDETLTALLSSAYSKAGAAGHDCYSGAGHQNDLLSRSATERVSARRDLIKALARFDLVTTG